MQLRKKTNVLLFALVFATIVLSASSLRAQSAFAKVNGNGAVVTFGGSDTTSASAVHSGIGQYTVTFNGTYLPTITNNDVVINTTAESFNYGVTNAFVISATPAQIVIYVYVWTSSNLNLLDNPIFISVNVGTPPPLAAASSDSGGSKQ